MKSLLQNQDWEIFLASSGYQLDQIIDEVSVDLVILDIMLPDETGLSVCARLLNRTPSLSVIFVSAFAGESDIVVGLEVGADDYLAKPYRPRELLARIRSALRRRRKGFERSQAAGHSGAYVFDGWRLSIARHELLTPHGGHVDLSPAEFTLLSKLVSQPKKLLSRQELMRLSSQNDPNIRPEHVNVTMSRLRSKLHNAAGRTKFIRTVRNKGYIFDATVQWLQQ